MNNAISAMLNKILGNWLINLNAENLNLSIFAGTVDLENLSLKPNVFQALGFPFQVKFSRIGKIRIKIQ